MNRPNWEQYFLSLAAVVATRGSCSRASVGCVIIDENNRIVSTGYNGAIPGSRHCDHTPVMGSDWEGNDAVKAYGDMEDGHCSNALHAEMNAIAHAAASGVALRGCTAYVTHAPCRPCYQMLRAAGVELIIYRTAYRLHPLVASSAHVRQENR